VFPVRYGQNCDILFEINVFFKGLKEVEEATPTALV
jgi:hypothetical protein